MKRCLLQLILCVGIGILLFSGSALAVNFPIDSISEVTFSFSKPSLNASLNASVTAFTSGRCWNDKGVDRWDNEISWLDFSTAEYAGKSDLELNDASFRTPGIAWITEKVYLKDCEQIPQAPVPEPATILLFGIGLVGLASASRKMLFKK